MIIQTPDPATAEGSVAAHYAADLASDGFVFSHTRAMAVNPEALDAFEHLIRAIVPSLGLRTYELVTLAAAAIRSPHCLLAHGRKTLTAGVLDEDQLVAMSDGAAAGLSDAEVAAMRFAQKLSTAADEMTDVDSQELRAAGFSDRQIVDIALAAGARNHFSRALQALAVPLEEPTGLSSRARAALLSPLER